MDPAAGRHASVSKQGIVFCLVDVDILQLVASRECAAANRCNTTSNRYRRQSGAFIECFVTDGRDIVWYRN